MRVLPGSHKARRVMDHQSIRDSRSTLPLSLKGLALDHAVDVPVKAGSYSVHDCFTLHGSDPNVSDRRRCGITIKYIPSSVRVDQTYVSQSGFDWANLRIFHGSGARGDLPYAN